MENVRCLLYNFPLDLFIFFILIGLLLFWILSSLIKKRYTNEIDALNRQIASLGKELDDCLHKDQDKDIKAFVPPPIVQSKIIIKEDLKRIEGIGPKIEQLLNKAEIYSFSDLADTSVDRLQEILNAAGQNYAMHKPGTWPRQAALARDSKWEELKDWRKN